MSEQDYLLVSDIRRLEIARGLICDTTETHADKRSLLSSHISDCIRELRSHLNPFEEEGK